MKQTHDQKTKIQIKTLSEIERANQKHSEPNRPFKPMPNQFFKCLSHYQKTEEIFEVTEEKPYLVLGISHLSTIIDVQMKLERPQDFPRHLTDPKYHKILQTLSILFKQLKLMKYASIFNQDSKSQSFIKDHIEMPLLFLLNKFFQFLHGQASTYRFILTIDLLKLLYFDFELPMSRDFQSLEDNSLDHFKDVNAPSKLLYWKLMTMVWSRSTFGSCEK